jgi:allophanate hydrolase subunit 1
MRIISVTKRLSQESVRGIIEIIPTLSSYTVHFDPNMISMNALMMILKSIECGTPLSDDISISSRILRLPLAFEDSLTTQAVEKYRATVNPKADNCKTGSNLEYVAACNGVSISEAKAMILKTYWYNSGGGFRPGGGFFFPMDPGCALVSPKYNPPRELTPVGAVGIGGHCLYTYGTETAGEYQLVGRTIPTLYSLPGMGAGSTPFLFRIADRLHFYEVSEPELNTICSRLNDGCAYGLIAEDSELKLRDYLAWIESDEIKIAARKLERGRVIY